jgi:hypothetical protein
MKRQTESSLVRACLQLLTLAGVVCWRNNTGAHRAGRRLIRYGEPGSPDILGIVPPEGRLLGVECKRRPNTPTDLQETWGQRARTAGALYLVVHDVRELEERLREEGILL